MKQDSPNELGTVTTQVVKLPLPAEGFRLECGRVLPELHVAYETYGALASDRTNAVFVCHALSGDAHVAGLSPAGVKGWWDEMIGPGRGIDTNFYHVICANILGGCRGTTGPSSLNPATGQPYGSTFPPITVGDIVDVHRRLLDHLGIQRLAAVIGGSLGGMQVLEWAIRHPDTLERAICIASAVSLSAQALAFDVVGRSAILSDPGWQGGDYYASGQRPEQGLALARKIGHITYLSPEIMAHKFGRGRHDRHPVTPFRSNFQVESYLDHQGDKFVSRFDANSYLHITHAMDEYDLEARFEPLETAFAGVRAKVLVIALSSDWLFPPEQSEEIASTLLRAGKPVSYCLLQAPYGHDAFLVDIKHLRELVRAFLPWVTDRAAAAPAATLAPPAGAEADAPTRTKEYDTLVDWIRPGARVLDVGCGGGALLTRLARERNTRGIGVDIAIDNVIDVIDRGHDVFQADIDAGLAMIPDNSFDYAILSETLQVVHKPRFVLREMLRVASEGIVSFPNFGNWANRLGLFVNGRMPKSRTLPFEWYDTPNIHLFTLRDFLALCRQDGLRVLELKCIPDCALCRLFLRLGLRNLGATRVLARIAKTAACLILTSVCGFSQLGT